MILVKPNLKKNCFIFNSKKWFENPGRDNLVSERSLRKLRPLGRLLSQWVACEVLVVGFGIHVHEHLHCIDIDP